MRSELCARRNDDLGLVTQETHEVSKIDCKRRQCREQIAARLRGTGKKTRASKNANNVIADCLMLLHPIFDPAGWLAKPTPEDSLIIAGCAQ